MTDFVFAITAGFLLSTRFFEFVSSTVERFIENDKDRTNKVDKQLKEVKERVDKMEKELYSIISFATRSSYTGKGVYQTCASTSAGGLELLKMTEDDLKKFGDMLDEISIKEVREQHKCPYISSYNYQPAIYYGQLN